MTSDITRKPLCLQPVQRRIERPVLKVPVQKERLITKSVLWLWPALCISPERSQMAMNFAQQTHLVSVHGRRAWAAGYANAGLEIWAGALHIAVIVHPEFRRSGDVTSISGKQIVRAISVDPSHFSRTYVGPDFSVEERAEGFCW